MASSAPRSLIVEIFTFLGISLCFVGFRVFCRIRRNSTQGLKADDYLMLCATIPSIIYTIQTYEFVMTYRGLANDGMSDEERVALSPDSEEYKMRVIGSKLQFTSWITWLTAMWAIKASMCAFYRRLTAGIYYNFRIWFGFGFIATTYIACMCCVLFNCWPLHQQWQINPNPGKNCQPAFSAIDYYVCITLDAVTEIYLLAIIIPLFWVTQLPISKKISLTLLFSGGLVVILATSLTAVDSFKAESSDDNAGIEGIVWSCREIFVALVTTNIPMILGWVRDKLRLFISFGSPGSSRSQENINALEESAGLGETGGNGWGIQLANSTTNIEGFRISTTEPCSQV